MKTILLACFLLAFLTSPALADSPALGPWDVLSTAQATRFITTAKGADLLSWSHFSFRCDRYGFRLELGRRPRLAAWPALTISGGTGIPPPPPNPFHHLAPYRFGLIVATPTYWRKWVWR